VIVADIVSRVTRTFGDESGAQITDADIFRWINDGQNEIAQLHELLESTAESDTVPGTVDYTLPNNMVRLKAVYYDGRPLEVMSNAQFDESIARYNDGDSVPVGSPYIVTSWGNKVSLYPAPVEAKTLKLRYVCFPAPVDKTSDQLNLPLRYHNRLVEYVMQQAYELDENFEAMTLKSQQFANSMSQNLGDEQWDVSQTYPVLTVREEDAW